MANKNKNNAGRKGKFKKWLTEEGLVKIENWAIMGATHKEIAKAMKIAESTLYEWIKKFPKISESLKNGDGVADAKVVIEGFKKATGFYYTEEQAHKVKTKYYDPESKKVLEKEEIELVNVKKYMPADTTANIFWRKNRDPKNWADKQQVEHQGSVDILHIIEELSGDKF